MTEAGDALVVAVSDGHGSPQSVRSHIGAQTAVRLSTTLLAADVPAPSTVGEAERLLLNRARSVVNAWAAEVLEHIDVHPMSAEELDTIPDRDLAERDPLRLYGSTLLISVVTSDWVGLIQLGDGDIVVRTRRGTVVRPMPVDETLIAGETTSLCLTDAAHHVRVVVLDVANEPIDFVLIATDGYGNAFADPTWPDDVAADMAAHLQAQDTSWFQERLAHWLEESAEVGGDDVTVALVVGPVRGQPPGARTTRTVAPSAADPPPELAQVDPPREATLPDESGPAAEIPPASPWAPTDPTPPAPIITEEIPEPRSTPPTATPKDAARKAHRARRWVVVAVIALLAGATIAFAVLGDDDSAPPNSTLTTQPSQTETLSTTTIADPPGGNP